MLGLDPADRVNPQSQCRWRQGWSSLESLKKLEIIMRWTDRGKTRERMEEEGGTEGEEEWRGKRLWCTTTSTTRTTTAAFRWVGPSPKAGVPSPAGRGVQYPAPFAPCRRRARAVSRSLERKNLDSQFRKRADRSGQNSRANDLCQDSGASSPSPSSQQGGDRA